MLALRMLNEKDVDTVRNWLAQEYIVKWFGNASDWLEEIAGRNGKYRFIRHFIAEDGNSPIGFCQYYDWREAFGKEGQGEPDGTFGIDYLVGEPSMLGKGRGSAIISLICKRVRADEPDVFQIVADPIVEPARKNIPSIRALEANGFIYDAKHRIYRKLIAPFAR